MPVFLFDSTHHALWAEEIALERGLAVQVVPAPPEAEAKCDLALEALPEEVESLAAALAAAGIQIRLHPGT